MDFLTNPDKLYWITGFVALVLYWISKPKGEESLNLKNVGYSALTTFLALAVGSATAGDDPGGMSIMYALTTGISAGTTVKTIADIRISRKK